MSTSLLRVSSIGQHALKMEAESRAQPNPIHLDLAKDGVVSSMRSNTSGRLIVELENRRKSGRSTLEKCTLDLTQGIIEPFHPVPSENKQDVEALDFGATFNLGISDRQRESKDGVVLPHFNAQEIHLSERCGNDDEIEYTLDVVDDFDDEEDEEDLLM
jgi:elongator complex protein 5